MIAVDLPQAAISPPTMQCLIQESQKQQIPPPILLAVLQAEKGTVGRASRNTNGTYDLGPAQYNTSNIPELYRQIQRIQPGIQVEHVTSAVMNDGCFSIAAAAWWLKKKIVESRGDLWEGVGRYHSKTMKYKVEYQQRVYRNYQQIMTYHRDLFGAY